MNKGYIYIMTNKALQNMVKIGYTTDVENRRKTLSTTALPYEYKVYATYETTGKLEDKQFHKLIDKLNPDLRVTKNREFFMITPEDAYELLEAVALISGTKDKLKKRKAATASVVQKAKKPPVNFSKCGIPLNAELEFVDDSSVKVTVYDDRKVLYNGSLTSLSAVAKELKGYTCAGPSFFKYNGELISDIAARTQWK